MEFEMFGSGEDTGNVTVKGLEQEKYTFLKMDRNGGGEEYSGSFSPRKENFKMEWHDTKGDQQGHS